MLSIEMIRDILLALQSRGIFQVRSTFLVPFLSFSLSHIPQKSFPKYQSSIMNHQHHLHLHPTQQRSLPCRAELHLVCHHFTGKDTRSPEFRRFLLRNRVRGYVPWQGDLKHDKSTYACRRETIRRIFAFLISYDPTLEEKHSGEIVAVAHLIECNLFISSPTKEEYCNADDLGRRALVVLRYIVQVIMLSSETAIGIDDKNEASVTAVAA